MNVNTRLDRRPAKKTAEDRSPNAQAARSVCGGEQTGHEQRTHGMVWWRAD